VPHLGEQGGAGRGEGGRQTCQTVRSLNDKEMTIVVAKLLCNTDIFFSQL
jgi:hypothetical protein